MIMFDGITTTIKYGTAEEFVFEGVPTQGDLDQVKDYLDTKWGL